MAEFTKSDRQLINRAADIYPLRQIKEMLRWSRLAVVPEEIAFWEEVLKTYLKHHPEDAPKRQGTPLTTTS